MDAWIRMETDGYRWMHGWMDGWMDGLINISFDRSISDVLLIEYCVKSLLNDKILDWSKLKAFADDKIIVDEKLKIWLRKG